MNGVFHGQFDPAKMDSDALGKLIEDYGKDTVLKRPTRIIKAILTIITADSIIIIVTG